MTPPSPPEVVIEICGEGKSDVGKLDTTPVTANLGIVPVLTRRLCNDSPVFRVIRRPYMFLQGKGRWQKVLFAKRTAKIGGSAGCVFVLDSEGDLPGVRAEFERGRRVEHLDFPMAVGVAHPCIEAWLLSDAPAVRRGFGLNQRPPVPPDPETLPAPAANRNHNPKTVLEGCHPNRRHPNLAEKTAMAEHLVLATAEAVCPSFAAFATDVRARLGHLFPRPPSPPSPAPSGENGDADEQHNPTP